MSEKVVEALRVERAPRTVIHLKSWADLEVASEKTGELIIYVSTRGVKPHYAVISRNAIYVLDAERAQRRDRSKRDAGW